MAEESGILRGEMLDKETKGNKDGTYLLHGYATKDVIDADYGCFRPRQHGIEMV
jgi:hypothetical protein